MSTFEELLPIRSLTFVEVDKEHSDEILVPRSVLQRWMEHYPPGCPLLATLTNPETEQVQTVCIGSHNPDTNDRTVYAPLWIMDQISTTIDDPVSLQPLFEQPLAATKLVLKPLDKLAYDTDFRSVMEEYLDMFHVLQTGTTLTVPVKDLGGYEISVYVETTEPDLVVRLGGEVEVEIVPLVPDKQDNQEEQEDQILTNSDEPVPNEVIVPVETPKKPESEAPISHKERMRLAWLKRFDSLQQQGQSPAGTAPQTSEATSKSSGKA
uniref:Ubiquitin fusion degradation protein n=1 Tax=viral metagenome TaxID=1070528 RepID=A0A6C0APY3_9ZZZZ